jgi:hypothetical protein
MSLTKLYKFMALDVFFFFELVLYVETTLFFTRIKQTPVISCRDKYVLHTYVTLHGIHMNNHK